MNSVFKLNGSILGAVLSAIFPGLLLSACAPQTSSIDSQASAQILGGERVRAGDAIADVTVKVVVDPGNYERTCSGTLVGPNTVLTAAHCAELRPSEIVLFDGTVLKVKKAWMHPRWKKDADAPFLYDFALLRLSSKVSTWAKIPGKNSEMLPWAEAMIAGYGSHLPNDQGYGRLYSFSTTVNPTYSDVQMKVIEGDGVGACNGDSGGPLYVSESGQVTVWGVDSTEGPDPHPGATCGTSEIYSNVQSVRGWILRVIRN